jgi:hypothetical protein
MSSGTEGLSNKHQRFVEEYLKDLNAVQAYQRAGYAARGNSAIASASRLRNLPMIAAAIESALAARKNPAGAVASRKQRGLALECPGPVLGSELDREAFVEIWLAGYEAGYSLRTRPAREDLLAVFFKWTGYLPPKKEERRADEV